VNGDDHPYNSSIGLSQGESTVTSTQHTAQLRLGQKKSPCRHQVNHQQEQTLQVLSGPATSIQNFSGEMMRARACVNNVSAKPL
jgi:hypothetical protein